MRVMKKKKNATKYILTGTDSWGILSGTEVEPEGNGTQRSRDGHKRFHKSANKAVALIYGSLTPAIQSYVSGIAELRFVFTRR